MTRAPFTPDEIRAAEIEAAREEGWHEGMLEAAMVARSVKGDGWDPRFRQDGLTHPEHVAAAIEAKAKGAGR